MKRTIEFDVVQATSLSPFTENGKRILHYHFFHLDGDQWMFHWITEETDVGWLQQQINEGAIFIFE